MSGWSKFFILLAGCLVTLIVWPQYTKAGLVFMGVFFVVWTCIIMLWSLIVDLFALYKVEWLHRILNILLVVCMLGCVLYYFPLAHNQTPFLRLKEHQWPTVQDIKVGISRLTFNFDFLRRNVHRDANYVNQQLDDGTDAKKEFQKIIKKQQNAFDGMIEQLKPQEQDN